jgi:hypothetical protein
VDHLAARYLGEATLWWRIAERNDIMLPIALAEVEDRDPRTGPLRRWRSSAATSRSSRPQTLTAGGSGPPVLGVLINVYEPAG